MKKGFLPPPIPHTRTIVKHWILLFYILTASLFNMEIYGQATCSSAVLQSSQSAEYNLTSTEFWIKFYADTNFVNIGIFKSRTTPETQLQSLELYSGDCSTLNLQSSINLGDSFLFQSNLIIGNYYYIKLTQFSAINSHIGIQLGVLPVNNVPKYCPTTYNLVPNGCFDESNVNVDLMGYWTNTPPTSLNVYAYNSPFFCYGSANSSLSNICGWFNGDPYPGYTSPQLKREVIGSNFNYYLYFAWASSWNEKTMTVLNNGNNILADDYLLRFKHKKIAGNITGTKIYLSNSSSFNSNAILIADKQVASLNYEQEEQLVTITSSMITYKYLYVVPYGNTSLGSGSLAFDEIQLLKLQITGGPNTICQREEATLSAELCNDVCPEDNLTVSYLWTSSPTDASLVGQETQWTIHVTPNVTTTYTVTATTNLGTSITKTKIITVIPSPPIPEIAGDIHSCGMTNSQYSIQNYDNTTTYYYEIEVPGAGVFGPYSIGSSTFVVDWTDPLYTDITTLLPINGGNMWILHVNNSYSNGCISVSDFNVFPCCNSCQQNNGKVFTDYTFTKNESFNGMDICINGTITIPNNIRIQFAGGCILNMGGMSNIIVENGGELILEGVIIQSCDQLNMWDRIKIEGESAYLSATGSSFFDGITCIESTQGGEYIIQGCTFEQNYICLDVNDYSGDHPGSLITNNFSGINNLMYYPKVGLPSLFCITVSDIIKSNTNLQIGNSASIYNVNNINNFPTAININNGDVTIRNVVFDNNGTCVNSQGSDNLPILMGSARNLTIGGNIANQSVNFNNTSGSVVNILDKSDLHFYNNTINNSQNGIIIEHSYGTLINIVDNQILDIGLNNAIKINDIMSIIDIQSNIISGNSTLYGIKINGNHNSQSPYVPASTSICSNTLSDFMIGISLNETIKPRVISNTITQINSTYNYEIGIFLANQIDAKISTNMISYPGVPTANDQTRLSGLFSISSPFTEFYNNNFEKQGSGIFIKGNNDPYSIVNNILVNNYDAICFEDGLIGDQGTASNAFNNFFSNNTWNFDVTAASSSSPSTNWHFNPVPNPFPNNTGINPLAASSTFFPSAILCQSPTPAPPVAQPLSLYGSGKKLNLDSLRFASLGGLIQKFYPLKPSYLLNNKVNINIYASNEVYLTAQNIYKKLNGHQNLLNLNNSNDIIYNTIYNQLNLSNIGKIIDIEKCIFAGNSQKATNLLNQFQPQNLFEINAFEVYTIYNSTWAVGIYSFNTLDSALLFSIAYQSPRIGGNAVFTARYMLGLDLLDLNSGIHKIKKSKSETFSINFTSVKTVKTYPNPAKDDITFELLNQNTINGEIQIYNSLGILVMSQNINGSKKIVNTSKFENGIFFFKLISNDQIIDSGKFIIQR
jgi:hypothetical protein